MDLPRRIVVPLIILVILLMAGGIAVWPTRSQTPKFTGPPEQIRLGTSVGEYSSLIWIAEDRGYFVENGLDVTIKIYESGHMAIEDLLAGNLDIATAAQLPLVIRSFKRKDIRILADIDRFDTLRVVARKDRGIQGLSDLKGKRIGVARGTSAEFWLATSLILNNIPPQEIQVVDLNPSQQISAITNGEIDAAIVWEPFVRKLQHALGRNAISLPGQGGQEQHWMLVCKDGIIDKRPTLVTRLLSALLRAEEFVTSDQPEAKAIAARRLGFEMPYLDSLWKHNQFKVLLPQSLLLAMEERARWLISAGLTKRTEIPDFLDLIYLDGLKALKPEAVTIIH